MTLTTALACALILVGGALILVAAFIGWAYLVQAQADAGMRAFSENWAKLSPEEREQQIANVRAMREALDRKKRPQKNR